MLSGLSASGHSQLVDPTTSHTFAVQVHPQRGGRCRRQLGGPPGQAVLQVGLLACPACASMSQCVAVGWGVRLAKRYGRRSGAAECEVAQEGRQRVPCHTGARRDGCPS